MNYKYKLSVLVFTLFSYFSIFSQVGEGTFPVFSDYLSDNIFLVHPSAAGIGNCGKIRLTAGSYWAGNELQTASYHNKFGEKAAFGIVAFNDKNGFHSQKGIQGTYAYHIPMDDGNTFRQLSFGLAGSAVQNQSDRRTFEDPEIQKLIESSTYFNADFSLSYHHGGLSSYLTVKNLLLIADNDINNTLEPLNLRNYILSAGYYFGEELAFQLEPSFMLQYKQSLGQTLADVNVKVYKKFDEASTVWAALSYRKSFDGNNLQELQQFTPILGFNYNRFMFSYTYSKQLGEIQFSNSAFHQVTVGLNIFCRTPRASACPNINASF